MHARDQIDFQLSQGLESYSSGITILLWYPSKAALLVVSVLGPTVYRTFSHSISHWEAQDPSGCAAHQHVAEQQAKSDRAWLFAVYPLLSHVFHTLRRGQKQGHLNVPSTALHLHGLNKDSRVA